MWIVEISFMASCYSRGSYGQSCGPSAQYASSRSRSATSTACRCSFQPLSHSVGGTFAGFLALIGAFGAFSSTVGGFARISCSW